MRHAEISQRGSISRYEPYYFILPCGLHRACEPPEGTFDEDNVSVLLQLLVHRINMTNGLRKSWKSSPCSILRKPDDTLIAACHQKKSSGRVRSSGSSETALTSLKFHLVGDFLGSLLANLANSVWVTRKKKTFTAEMWEVACCIFAWMRVMGIFTCPLSPHQVYACTMSLPSPSAVQPLQICNGRLLSLLISHS